MKRISYYLAQAGLDPKSLRARQGAAAREKMTGATIAPAKLCPDEGGQPGLSGSKSQTFGNAAMSVQELRGQLRVDAASKATNRPALRLVSSRCLDTASPQARPPRAVVSRHLVLIGGHAVSRW